MFFVCFKASAEKLSAIKIESLEDLKLKKKLKPAPAEAAPTTSTPESSSTLTVHDQIASQPPSLSPPPPRATIIPTIVKPTIVLPTSTSTLANSQSRNESKSENESFKSGNESSKSGSESSKSGDETSKSRNDLSKPGSKPPHTESLGNSMYNIIIKVYFIINVLLSDAGEPQSTKTQLPLAMQQSQQDVQTKKKRRVYIIRKRSSADADSTVPEDGHPLPKRNRRSVKEGAIASRVLKGIIAQRTTASRELNHQLPSCALQFHSLSSPPLFVPPLLPSFLRLPILSCSSSADSQDQSSNGAALHSQQVIPEAHLTVSGDKGMEVVSSLKGKTLAEMKAEM